MRIPKLNVGKTKRLLLWFFITFFFGFFQLFIDFFQKYMKSQGFDSAKFIASGSVLFFSSGLIASSAFDIWSAKEIRSDKITFGFVIYHIITPFICLLVISITYSSLSSIEIQNDPATYEKFYNLQMLALLITMAYSILCRLQLIESSPEPKELN